MPRRPSAIRNTRRKTVRPTGARGDDEGQQNDRRAAKREAIRTAALDEFSAKGDASTRPDDVARRAGVAKGTIYLYFADKEALFQELVRSTLSPVVGGVEQGRFGDMPLPALAERIVGMFVQEILGTRRQDVIRLVLLEGARFP